MILSAEYDALLREHQFYVKKGYFWLEEHLPEVLIPGYYYTWYILFHDSSKRDSEEYSAFDEFIFGERTDETKRKHKRAQLEHRHKNPHHWEYWVLYTSSTRPIALDMDYPYIIEMICDWWSFSWKEGDLFNIFDWYDEHKDNILMSNKTRATVEDILDKLEAKLIKVRGPRIK